MARLTAVVPVSDEDITALPVQAIEPAAAFYRDVLGFSIVRSDATAAVVARDGVRIGLVARPDHDPGRAGSLAIEVDDLDAMHRELERSGAKPGIFGTDEWNGKSHRTFFVREDENGYCYCYYHPA